LVNLIKKWLNIIVNNFLKVKNKSQIKYMERDDKIGENARSFNSLH